MKTTNDLPDDWLVKAKMLAAERRATPRELVLEGLKRVTETPPEAEQAERRSSLTRLLKAMQASNLTPMLPLNRNHMYDR